MTTKHSPVHVLKAQADKMADTIMRAERGETIDARFAERIAAARQTENLKVGIVMDDKVIALTLPWTVIRSTSAEGLSEYIVKLMCEAGDA